MSYTELLKSYEYSINLTKRNAKNFYYGICVLPEKRKRSLCAFYAFTRLCDDVSDNQNKPASEKNKEFSIIRNRLESLFVEKPSDIFWLALRDTIKRYKINPGYLFDVINGTEMDLKKNRYKDTEELNKYCYLVAGSVGIVTLHILGVNNEEAFGYGKMMGRAFQYTNILRDIIEDKKNGRIYLPSTLLDKYSYSESDIDNKKVNKNFFDLINELVQYTRQSYKEGEKVFYYIHNYRCRLSVSIMSAIYYSLLEKISRTPSIILTKNVSLSLQEKYFILLKEIFKNIRF